MSNLNNEHDYSNLTSVINFAFQQMMKGVYTAFPALIESYDATTKRAVVKVAINMLKTDGQEVERPIIANVPVIHPSGGGFVLHTPLRRGDPILCVFSSRGISNFKDGFSQSSPDEGFFDIKDAIALAGFGALSISPATNGGISMQDEEGGNAVYVEQGHIRLQTSGKVQVDCAQMEVNANVLVNGSITWTGTATGAGGSAAKFTGGVTVTGGAVAHNGTNIGDTHTHSGVETGSGATGAPQ